jgi:hypothetical protein
MKKIILASALFISLVSCTGSSTEEQTTTVDSTACKIDSMCVKTDSTACDTTKVCCDTTATKK